MWIFLALCYCYNKLMQCLPRSSSLKTKTIMPHNQQDDQVFASIVLSFKVLVVVACLSPQRQLSVGPLFQSDEQGASTRGASTHGVSTRATCRHGKCCPAPLSAHDFTRQTTSCTLGASSAAELSLNWNKQFTVRYQWRVTSLTTRYM